MDIQEREHIQWYKYMMELQEYNMIDEFQFKDMCMQICEYCLYICLMNSWIATHKSGQWTYMEVDEKWKYWDQIPTMLSFGGQGRQFTFQFLLSHLESANLYNIKRQK